MTPSRLTSARARPGAVRVPGPAVDGLAHAFVESPSSPRCGDGEGTRARVRRQEVQMVGRGGALLGPGRGSGVPGARSVVAVCVPGGQGSGRRPCVPRSPWLVWGSSIPSCAECAWIRAWASPRGARASAFLPTAQSRARNCCSGGAPRGCARALACVLADVLGRTCSPPHSFLPGLARSLPFWGTLSEVFQGVPWTPRRHYPGSFVTRPRRAIWSHLSLPKSPAAGKQVTLLWAVATRHLASCVLTPSTVAGRVLGVTFAPN